MYREPKHINNLFFLCSLIEEIGRQTLNERAYVVNALGKDTLSHIYDLADVYHCEDIRNTADDFINQHNIGKGNYDNVGDSMYTIPTVWEIGRVFCTLIVSLTKDNKNEFIDKLIEVYNSWIVNKIEDYNCAMYYSEPEFIYFSYLVGEPYKAFDEKHNEILDKFIK